MEGGLERLRDVFVRFGELALMAWRMTGGQGNRELQPATMPAGSEFWGVLWELEIDSL